MPGPYPWWRPAAASQTRPLPHHPTDHPAPNFRVFGWRGLDPHVTLPCLASRKTHHQKHPLIVKPIRLFPTSIRLGLTLAALITLAAPLASAVPLENDFVNPPDSARPGVYWYFMDGNLDGKEMLKDLESMKDVGLGNLIFLEVDVGVPRGPVKFMSDPWQDLFANAVHHAERLGIDITLGAGPGWCGSGGPWVKPEQSMQHLVFSTVETKGPAKFDAVLPMPPQHIDAYHNMPNPFYQDVVVFTFPKCDPVIADINEKALYQRNPFSSMPGVKPYLPATANLPLSDVANAIDPAKLLDITSHLQPDGKLTWDVPPGEWTILRMGRRSTGANTRPAPAPGAGLEHDKFDPAALDEHFSNYYAKLLAKVGSHAKQHGWTAMHLDSWEMGAQNWTPKFRDEFRKRRGYDPMPFFVTYSGRAFKSLGLSERFLWDMRLTAQELVLENYAGHLKELGHKQGFELSIEPYDMNPTADLDLGAMADVPMCEFWSAGIGFDSSFSCIEASSIAHTMGRPIVAAESFTANSGERWQQYPGSMKNQGDWAFCMGVNRFVFHTFAHKPLGDDYRPGMTMGPYGVHWDRGQTWWPMVKDYHLYVTRCSHLLRQGVTVSDILYLTPEGAPHVFRPPPSALIGANPLADKKGYGFDGCSPNILMARATVEHGRIVFPGGSSYQLMVLPRTPTMTPALLEKITRLTEAGAVVIGTPPVASPSLTGYPQCDAKVRELADNLWGESTSPTRQLGKGRVIADQAVDFRKASADLYPAYATTAAVLEDMHLPPDFQTDGPIRHAHRQTADRDIYFIANTSNNKVAATCTFRVRQAAPQLWDPVTGEIRNLPQFTCQDLTTAVPVTFEPYQSFFVLFPRDNNTAAVADAKHVNFPASTPVVTLDGPWDVAFDPKSGGLAKTTFDTLRDWTASDVRGIKYYSGIATYRKSFDLPNVTGKKIYLDLGVVHDIARVTLNGKNLGVVWCAPWQVDLTGVAKDKGNTLEIEIANRWPNRMLGDQQPPDKDARTVKWPSGLLEGREFKTGRYTFATTTGLGQLLPSGLLGPVRVLAQALD